MKKDLNEFSDTVQQEASSIASVAANSVKKPAQFFQHQFSQLSDNAPEGENNESSKVNNTNTLTDSISEEVNLSYFVNSLEFYFKKNCEIFFTKE